LNAWSSANIALQTGQLTLCNTIRQRLFPNKLGNPRQECSATKRGPIVSIESKMKSLGRLM
jgi:hypothetical protein